MSDPVLLGVIIAVAMAPVVFGGVLAALRVDAWLERRATVHRGA